MTVGPSVDTLELQRMFGDDEHRLPEWELSSPSL